MDFIKRHLWKIIRWAAGVLLAIVVVPVVGGYFDNLAETHGVYGHPEKSGVIMILWLARVATSLWFQIFVSFFGGFVLGTWLDTIFGTRRPEKPDGVFAVEFDPNNSDGNFVFTRWENYDDGYSPRQIVRYCLKLTNRTKKTINGVSVVKKMGNGQSDRLQFRISGGFVCDLHPLASDYVMIYEYDEHEHIQWCEDEDYKDKFEWVVQVTAPDIITCEKSIHIDVSGSSPVITVRD